MTRLGRAAERLPDATVAARAAPTASPFRRLTLPDPVVQPATDLTGVLILKHDNLFLLTDPFGDIHPDSRGLGLYLDDTRLLSHYELRINDQRPVVLRTGTGGSFSSALQMTNPAFLKNRITKQEPNDVLAAQSLGVLRERLLSGAFRDRITIRNYTRGIERRRLSLRLGADFADIFEVRGRRRDHRARMRQALVGPDRVVFTYRGADDRLARSQVALSEPARALDGELGFELDWELPPGGERSLEITIWGDLDVSGAAEEADVGEVSGAPVPVLLDSAPAAAHRAWQASAAAFHSSNAFADRALSRAMADLRMLVSQGPAEGERFISAGVPWFATLFGRDSIITALQLLSIRPQVAVEVLQLLARLQATEVDLWRDAEPGKILHELRAGEMARTGEVPHSPYYGSVDSTPLWLILLGETYRWTGDRALVEHLWPNALACLRWIDEFGDADGDGFVEYERRSPKGLLNQGWKDSGDANRYRDGSLADPPLALVEVQAYVYAARRQVARLARMLGDDGLSRAQEKAAQDLRDRFEASFWMEDAGTYALALDGRKQHVDGVASNAGHALWCGIASPERASRVAATLTGPEMWSGWGVRTLSSGMPGYNPIGYHIGTVWPHDNAILAEGLARYGHHEQAAQICAALLEATSYFRDARLPELFCGFDRLTSPLPVPYPMACVPQSWAAGALFQLMGSMLGLRPDAQAAELELRSPALPDWLPEVRVENLRVGEAVVDLLFQRSDGSTSVRVLRRSGDLAVLVHV